MMYPTDPAPTSATQAIANAHVCLRLAAWEPFPGATEVYIARAIRLLNWASWR